MRYRIGTRGSRLALAQAESVSRRLAEEFPEHQFELVVVKTTGDRFGSTPMREIGTKGIFIKELEEGLCSGALDLAVHSMKDMPALLPEGLLLAAPWRREDPRDVLIAREGGTLGELREGAVIATGSLRRKFQLLRLRPDLQVVDIRGNVETRIRRMEERKLDGIVLAAAGLKRLGLADRATQYFSVEEMLPAPAQGVIAIELSRKRGELLAMVNRFADEETGRTAAAERRFLQLAGGGCHLPVGAVGYAREGEILLRAMYGSETGSELGFVSVRSETPEAAAEAAARQLGLVRGEKI